MKMFDLGEKPMSASIAAPAKKGKPKPYYPSVSLEDVDGLRGTPLGKPIKLLIEAEVEQHSERETESGKKYRCEIRLKRVGLMGNGSKGKRDHVCPDCGKAGSAGYCPHCAVRMNKRKAY